MFTTEFVIVYAWFGVCIWTGVYIKKKLLHWGAYIVRVIIQQGTVICSLTLFADCRFHQHFWNLGNRSWKDGNHNFWWNFWKSSAFSRTIHNILTIFVLTRNNPCISKSCIEIKIKLNFYFHTSLWCLKSFYEGPPS